MGTSVLSALRPPTTLALQTTDTTATRLIAWPYVGVFLSLLMTLRAVGPKLELERVSPSGVVHEPMARAAEFDVVLDHPTVLMVDVREIGPAGLLPALLAAMLEGLTTANPVMDGSETSRIPLPHRVFLIDHRVFLPTTLGLFADTAFRLLCVGLAAKWFW